MTEHDQAKQWRLAHQLTRESLSEMTGYSPESIYWFEQGKTPPTRKGNVDGIKPWVWQRYKMACAGVHHKLTMQQNFSWGE